MKHAHEFRDPIHTFITVRSDERAVINSRPFQRLRNIHQLALTYFVYPGATHRRFEHSLGVMELATRIFDAVTAIENVTDPSVREIIPDRDALGYWRSVLRMAALCHDTGHLPFSHAAESALLPAGRDHESFSIDVILSPEMVQIWEGMTPPLRPADVVKLAIGPKKAKGYKFNVWESILSDIIVGDAFGADRMDYLLRDSYHAGVQYGRFDHNRLINTIRILPQRDKQTDEPALGLEAGGLESSEGLMIARHFIFSQVYLHHIRRIYDIHLVDFLRSWLDRGLLPINLKEFLAISDAEVIAAIRREAATPGTADRQVFARRIDERKHFRRFYTAAPEDKAGGKLQPGKIISDLAINKFGDRKIRYDYMPAKTSAPDFPVRGYDGVIHSSLIVSQILPKMPVLELDTVYCEPEILKDAIAWRQGIKSDALELDTQGRFAV